MEPKKISLDYRVPYADTDQMGVVYYANYLVYFERARNELMRACGYAYRACEEEGIAFPVLHAELDYRKPARYDDLLTLSAWCESFLGVRLTVRCEVRCGDTLLVSGHTVHATVDIRTLRPVRPSAKLIAAVGLVCDA